MIGQIHAERSHESDLFGEIIRKPDSRYSIQDLQPFSARRVVRAELDRGVRKTNPRNSSQSDALNSR